jgi:hypothetical protein
VFNNFATRQVGMQQRESLASRCQEAQVAGVRIKAKQQHITRAGFVEHHQPHLLLAKLPQRVAVRAGRIALNVEGRQIQLVRYADDQAGAVHPHAFEPPLVVIGRA